MRSDKVFPLVIMFVFSLFGSIALVGSFWNIWQLFPAAICAVIVLIAWHELKGG